ncbi:MAG: MBL fold metallo-hydrolase [Candidatus Aenigmatarchaeota archaeon]
MQILKGIIMMGGVGYDSNIYLIDGELIVDSGSGLFFSEIKEEISRLCDVSNIKYIVNTHCHYDHSGANRKFRDWLKTEIAIHENDKESLESGIDTLSEMFGEVARVTTVDRVLKNGSMIRTANFTFEVISTPGHTPGSICLYEKEKKILISGDTLFEDGIGRTDFPGGSKYKLCNSLKKLAKYPVSYLLPGHGMPKVGGVDFLIKQMIVANDEKEFF